MEIAKMFGRKDRLRVENGPEKLSIGDRIGLLADKLRGNRQPLGEDKIGAAANINVANEGRALLSERTLRAVQAEQTLTDSRGQYEQQTSDTRNAVQALLDSTPVSKMTDKQLAQDIPALTPEQLVDFLASHNRARKSEVDLRELRGEKRDTPLTKEQSHLSEAEGRETEAIAYALRAKSIVETQLNALEDVSSLSREQLLALGKALQEAAAPLRAMKLAESQQMTQWLRLARLQATRHPDQTDSLQTSLNSLVEGRNAPRQLILSQLEMGADEVLINGEVLQATYEEATSSQESLDRLPAHFREQAMNQFFVETDSGVSVGTHPEVQNLVDSSAEFARLTLVAKEGLQTLESDPMAVDALFKVVALRTEQALKIVKSKIIIERDLRIAIREQLSLAEEARCAQEQEVAKAAKAHQRAEKWGALRISLSEKAGKGVLGAKRWVDAQFNRVFEATDKTRTNTESGRAEQVKGAQERIGEVGARIKELHEKGMLSDEALQELVQSLQS
ncbi:MAG: hypothetical protein ABIJ33_02300 [Patescibacteria group bacterium]